MSLFTVRTQLLAAVAKWTSSDESRVHLNYVLFDGKHMVATDGHRIVAVTCVTERAPFTLHRIDCAALAAAQREITKRRNAELTFAAIESQRATIDLEVGRTMIVKTGDPKDFPPWQKLFEGLKAETPEPPSFAFEPRTIKVKAWTAMDKGGFCGPMAFESISFDGDEGYEMRFLIMPKRS